MMNSILKATKACVFERVEAVGGDKQIKAQAHPNRTLISVPQVFDSKRFRYKAQRASRHQPRQRYGTPMEHFTLFDESDTYCC